MQIEAFAANDGISDAQTEDGVRSLEEKHNMTLQGIKELVLGSVKKTFTDVHKSQGVFFLQPELSITLAVIALCARVRMIECNELSSMC